MSVLCLEGPKLPHVSAVTSNDNQVNVNRRRKNSASRLIASCQRYLSRQSSESSVSPQRVKKSSWYDGDGETSDSAGAGDMTHGVPETGARAKIRDLTR